MAALKAAKPVDHVRFEPVMLAVNKARAMGWVLDQLTDTNKIGNNLVNSLDDPPESYDVRGWLSNVVADALQAALDDVEQSYRKLRAGDRDGLLDEVATLAKEGL